MAARKRRKSEQLVDDESHDQKKRARVNDDVDAGEHSDSNADDATVKRLSVSQKTWFTESQTSETQRDAGLIEEVRVVNFMSHTNLTFEYVHNAYYLPAVLVEVT